MGSRVHAMARATRRLAGAGRIERPAPVDFASGRSSQPASNQSRRTTTYAGPMCDTPRYGCSQPHAFNRLQLERSVDT